MMSLIKRCCVITDTLPFLSECVDDYNNCAMLCPMQIVVSMFLVGVRVSLLM